MSDATPISTLSRTYHFGTEVVDEFNQCNWITDTYGIESLNSQSPIINIWITTDHDLQAVSGIKVDYRGKDDTGIASNGDDHPSEDPIELNNNESISSVSLDVSFNEDHNVYLVSQISFTIYDKSTSKARLTKSYGFPTTSKWGYRRFQFDGEIFGFGGYETKWESSPTKAKIVGLYFMVKNEAPSPLLAGYEPRLATLDSNQPYVEQEITLQPPRTGNLESAKVVYGLHHLQVDGRGDISVRPSVRYHYNSSDKVSYYDVNSIFVGFQSVNYSQNLHAGGINIVELSKFTPEIQCGVIPYTQNNLPGTHVPFSSPFPALPKVICWLTAFDMERSQDWQIGAWANYVNMTGFDISSGSQYNSGVRGTSACWLAVASGSENVVVGKFTADRNLPTGYVKFERKLSGKPVVICGLSEMNLTNGHDLVIKATVDKATVTREGFTWKVTIDDWGWKNPTTFSYIAIVNYGNPFDLDLDARSATWDTTKQHIEAPVPLEPPRKADKLPNIVHGLYHLDLDRRDRIQARSTADGTSKDSFVASIHLAGAQRNAGGINCIDLPSGGKIQGGVVSYEQIPAGHQKVLVKGTFEPAFSKPPKVIIWLTGFNFDNTRNWRIEIPEPTVTETDFSAEAGAWGDTILHHIGVSWLAVPADAEDVATGKFVVKNGCLSGKVEFNPKLPGTPRVVYALSHIDFGCQHDLLVKPTVDQITSEGFHYSATIGEGDRKGDAVYTEFSYIATVRHDQ